MRKSIIAIILAGVVMLAIAIRSQHALADQFLGTIVFQFGYVLGSLFLLYVATRYVLGIRRHEMIEACGGKGSNGHLAIYCVTMLCIALIISFAGSVS